MRHFFETWKDVQERLARENLILFLDYDGTLAPIAALPHLAVLPVAQKNILSELTSVNEIWLAIISGRALVDVKERVGLPGVFYAGNYGLELEGPGIQHVHPSAIAAKNIFAEIALKLQSALQGFAGLLIENKALTLSVHYRQLPKDEWENAWLALLRVLYPYIEQSQIIMSEGKMVWEIHPALEWNKAAVTYWLMDYIESKHSISSICPIFIGDDRGDESAFKAVKNRGFGIRVTQDPSEYSNANYFLSTPDEVLTFLARIKALKSIPHAH